ncbi:MAG: alpha/beta fold hydrolase [Myxococcota bacterium]|nr:alpha/beta hydrolase [Myxococcota bacterium]
MSSRTTEWLVTYDGVRLRYGRWQVDKPKAVAVILTGRNEFVEKYDEIARELNERQFDVWTLDWRGQGMSTRALPNRQRGYVASFAWYLSDLRAFLQRIEETTPDLPRFIFGHSMGGHITLRYLHDFPESVTAAVVTAPMIDMTTRRFPPGLARVVVELGMLSRLAHRYIPGMRDYDPSEDLFDTNENTSDRDRFERRVRLLSENPELLLGGVTFGWLDAAFRSIALLQRPEYLRAVTTPLLMFAAMDDRVVNTSAIEHAARDLPNCQLVHLHGSRHEVMHENDRVRGEFWRHVDAFLAAHLPARIPKQRRRNAAR